MIMQRFSLGYECPREEPAFTGLNEAYFGHNGSGDWWLYSEPRVNPIADNSMIGMHDRTGVQSWARHEDPAPITSYNAVKVYSQGACLPQLHRLLPRRDHR